MTQRTPNLQEAMISLVDYSTAGMYTSIPGIVVSVENAGEKRVNVKPSLNMRSEDGDIVEERSVILNESVFVEKTITGCTGRNSASKIFPFIFKSEIFGSCSGGNNY